MGEVILLNLNTSARDGEKLEWTLLTEKGCVDRYTDASLHLYISQKLRQLKSMGIFKAVKEY